MKNYICINNRKVKLTDEQVREISESLGLCGKKLSEVAVGDTVRIGEREMIVLEQSGDTTALICRDLIKERQSFGTTNNYNGSTVDVICEDFACDLEKAVGTGNVLIHTVDLTSDDGLKDYGKIRRKASLLTTDLYRRYVEVLDKYRIDKWWWLATAHSTEKHGNTSWVKCVSPSGYFGHYVYDYEYGVRPFCILKSDIFVS